MPARLVAGAAGVVVIGAAVLAFLLPAHEVVAGTNRVELAHGSLIVPGKKHKCQRLPTVPRGADRLRLGIAGTYGGTVPALGLQIEQRGKVLGAGAVRPVREGTVEVPLLQPTLPATGRALICFNNPGEGFVSLKGELRKVANPGGRFVRRPVAGFVFLAPSDTSWLDRMGEVARRYGYSQAGALGPWTLSMVLLFGLAALLFTLASVLDADRESWRREWQEVTTTEFEAIRRSEREDERQRREELRRRRQREELRRRRRQQERRPKREWDE